MITFRSLSAAMSRSLAGRWKAEVTERARMAAKQAEIAANELAWRAERDRRKQALRVERELARREHAALTTISEPAPTNKQVEARTAHLRSVREQRDRIRAAIDPDNSVREAKKAQEEQLEQERLAFLSAQLARRV